MEAGHEKPKAWVGLGVHTNEKVYGDGWENRFRVTNRRELVRQQQCTNGKFCINAILSLVGCEVHRQRYIGGICRLEKRLVAVISRAPLNFALI